MTLRIFFLILFCSTCVFAKINGNADMIFSSKAPIVNGKLNDECWKNASFKSFSSKVKASNKVDSEIVEKSQTVKNNNDKRRSEFAITYTPQGIYVAVRCMEPNLKGLSTKCEMRDGLFEYFRKNDMVEFFLGNKANGSYYWFRTNPSGAKTDIYSKGGSDRSWDGVWEVATGREKNAWTVEMFFPFAGFNRMPFEDIDCFSIARYCPNKNVRSVWGGEYRIVKTWPELILNNYKIVKKTDYILKKMLITETGTKNSGLLSATIVSKSGKAQTVKPEFRIMRPSLSRGYFPQANGPRAVRRSRAVNIKTGSSTVISSKISIGADETAIVQLLLKDKQGKLLFASRDYGLRVKYNIAGPGPEFNYYTKEKVAKLRFLLRKTGKNMLLKLMLKSNGKTILTHKLKADKSEVSALIPAKNIPLGENKVVLRLLKGSKLIASRTFPLIKLAPNTNGSEVKIRRWSRSVIVDGKDFIPVGNSPMVPHHGLKYGLNMMKEMTKNHFNTMHLWGGYLDKGKKNKTPKVLKFDFDKYQKCFDGAAKNNLKVIASIGPLVGKNPSSPFTKWHYLTDNERIELIKKLVLQIRNRKELLSYEIFDEPGFFASPEWLEKIYRVIKKLDPYHLVTVNVCRGSRSVLPFLNATDMAGIDYYPIGKEPANSVVALTDDLVQFADWKPVKWWIQGYKIFNPAAPSPAEIKAMTYMTAAHGATSFFYFVGRPRRELWETQGESAKEMRGLTKALAADKIEVLSTEPANSKVYASYRERENSRWIIAVNESSTNQKVIINLPENLREKNLKIERVFDKSRPVAYSKGKIEASFAPLERQVYKIEIK